MPDNARRPAPGDIEAQVLAAIEEETEAFRADDFDRWCKTWLHDPRTTEVHASPEFGLQVIRGWDAVRANMANVFENNLRCQAGDRGYDIKKRVVSVDGSTAWVTYDLRWWNPDNESFEDNFETRILECHAGHWKIAYFSVISVRDAFAPPGRIGLDRSRRVVWASPGAEQALKSHPALTLSHGHLRARRPEWDRALGAVLDHAADYHGFYQSRGFAENTGRPFRVPVVLGEDEAGRVMTAIATVRDGVTYIDTDPEADLAQRLTLAQSVFCLSAAQGRLAAEIIGGQSLTAAAETLGVSINTARTQLGRIYDKTGVNSQTALVRLLLSVG
ncbi:MAG: nuclear transport factor 2 family protein [Pseudomonadota bacterium]